MIAYKSEGGARSTRDEKRVAKLLDHFGSTKLKDIGQHSLPGAYAACLRDGENTGPGGKLRGVFAPLHAILEAAALHKLCERPQMKAPKAPPAKAHWLKPDEVARLIAAAPDADAKALFVALFGIGPRASEVIDLEWPDVDLRGKRARLVQKQKLSKPERNADLPPVVVAALKALPHREGAVFRPRKPGERAAPAGEWQGYRRTRGVVGCKGWSDGGQFKKLWVASCARAGLPGTWKEYRDGRGRKVRQFMPRYTPHDARHTWATWFYAIHKDRLRLKRAGGWNTLSMVERYADLMPDEYRQEAIDWLAGRLVAEPPAPVAEPAKAKRRAAMG